MKLIDIGAHNGDTALKFISYADIDYIDAYDPNEDFKPLWRSIRDFYPTICFYPSAVSTYKGLADYDKRPPQHSLGASIMLTREDFGLGDVIQVPCVDILDIIPDVPFCLKIDAEGAELDILERLINAGKSDLVDRLYVEFHTEKVKADPRRERLIREHFGKRLNPWI